MLPIHTEKPALTTGNWLTVTKAVDTAMADPQLLLAVSVYMPAAAVVILLITGFCRDDVNPSGPVQSQLSAPVADDVNVSVASSQTGLGLAEAITEVGIPFIFIPGETNAVFPGPTPPSLSPNHEMPS